MAMVGVVSGSLYRRTRSTINIVLVIIIIITVWVVIRMLKQ